jgi:archaellum component FlaG (FlaF/FlaG flagellin family)
MLTFSVTNHGSAPVHAGVEKSVLLVNGSPHNGFEETVAEINNDRFDSLPPGETVRFHYLFNARGSIKTGEYTFVLRMGGNDSPPLTIRVVP